MEDSILISIKKILGVAANYDVFDLDILTHINMAFATLNQLGVGPTDVVMVTDDTVLWSELGIPNNQLSLIRTYISLKTRMLFDPPNTSFVIEAMNKQINELEWRLNVFREEATYG